MSQGEAHREPSVSQLTELAARLEEASRRARRLGVDRLELRYQADQQAQVSASRSTKELGPEVQEACSGEAGISVRAFQAGAIGHAAQAIPALGDAGRGEGEVYAAAIEAAVEAAVALVRSRAGGSLDATYRLETEEPPARGHHESPPLFALRASQAELLAEAAAALSTAAGEEGRSACVHLSSITSQRIFVSSDGASVTQRLRAAGGGMSLLVEANGAREERACPIATIEDQLAAGGWGLAVAPRLIGAAERLAEEARALVRAPLCPAGTTSIILTPELVCIALRETIGRALLGDRVLDEVGSFVDPKMLGRFRYGSTLVNLVADATGSGALGSFGWDDEGVPGQRTPLVQRGQLVGLLTTRRVAARLGLSRSGGCLRAPRFGDEPSLQLTNLVLEAAAGGPTLEELIADTPEGLLLGGSQRRSVDARGLEFELGCEAVWEIRGGRRTWLLRRPRYRGRGPRFWAGCDGIGREVEAHAHELSGREAEPRIGLSHRGPPARFHGVEVGTAR